MARFNPGDKVIITVEMSDGIVYHVPAYSMSMSVSTEFSSEPRGHFEFDTIGLGMWSTKEFKEHTNILKSASEWKCEFCGSVHPRNETGCHKCGAPRSVIYD